MNRKKLTIPVIFVFLVTFGVTYYLRNVSNTYYFESYRPPIACRSTISSVCLNGTIHVETVTGDDLSFIYTTAAPPKVINKAGLSSFKKGEKVQIGISGDNTGDDKVVRSIRAIN